MSFETSAPGAFRAHAHHDVPASAPALPGPTLRHDWTPAEVRALHDLPLFELLYRAQTVHRGAFGEHKVQLCSLLSIKTGGCPEDCGYCPQSAHHETSVRPERLMRVD